MTAESTVQSWVADLQTALNQRAAPRGYPPLAVDGILGPLTQQAVQDLGHALGIEPELLAAEQLTPADEELVPAVVRLFADPRQRSASQVQAAAQRAPGLPAREIELDGIKLAWGLVKPLVRARSAGWSGRVKRVVRGIGVLGEVFEGKDAWWHRVLEVSHEGQLSAILSQMGYVCELVAHSTGLVGGSGVRFLESPGEVAPGAAAAAAPRVTEAPVDPTASSVSPTPEPPAPSPASTSITGLDVSADQGPIDWDRVASAGHGFAFIRATTGVDTVDPQFASNWERAGAAGIRRGAYHLAEPADDPDPGDQAVHMTSALRARCRAAPADLPPSVVIDDLAAAMTGDQLIAWVRAFTSVFTRITHTPPAIRVNDQSLAQTLASDLSGLDGPVWILDGSPDETPCPGVTGPCPVCRFHGSQPQFDQLGSGAQPTQPRRSNA